MKKSDQKNHLIKEKAIEFERIQFEKFYMWLQKHMPDKFFKEIEANELRLIAHALIAFPMQDYFCQIQLKDNAFVLILDSPDVDLKILKNFNLHGIKHYQTFISHTPPPFPEVIDRLRIAMIDFTTFEEDKSKTTCELILSQDNQNIIYKKIQQSMPDISLKEFQKLVNRMNPRFLSGFTTDELICALLMFFRATVRDYCQYEVRYHKEWEGKKKDSSSMHLIFAWKNAPKYRFLYRLAKMIYRHHLTIVRVNASYVKHYKENNILIMSIELHGITGKAVWEETDVEDLLQELVTLKYFQDGDDIEYSFVKPGLARGNLGNLIRSISRFVHQILSPIDMNLYSFNHIVEGLCHHRELTVEICKAFEFKFHPKQHDLESYKKQKEKTLGLIHHLDTGSEINDTRRKNILKQAIYFVDHTLKTNFYRDNKSALSFRLDPLYLDLIPYQRESIFPELPYGIFFIHGMDFIGFHIRFKDLARGGLRTIFPQKKDNMMTEGNDVFVECYHLAYTQQKKNKDIPEGGAKGVIFLQPYKHLLPEGKIYQAELKAALISKQKIEDMLIQFETKQKQEILYQTQRAFIHSLITLVNCEDTGKLKAKNVVDYWEKPEYLYIGPDENMHNEIIEWAAQYSKHCHYRPGIAFTSSKPLYGINHKEYGVTSLGVNVYMENALKYLKINPNTDNFTVKISGGPDGDVAGNQILNLYRFFPKTAKLLAVTDISGTIFDPEGLDLKEMAHLFHSNQPIAYYPPKKLNVGGFLLDLRAKKAESIYKTKTLCWRQKQEGLIEDWLPGNEMNHLLRYNLNQVKTDIFIPAGGRPHTLNTHNYTDFLDEQNIPTAKAIIEGANLYLSPQARHALEKLGVLIVKDSSANKGGVICSSLEVLAGLTLTEEEFIKEKKQLMEEVLDIIKEKAQEEAFLLFKTHEKTGAYLTDLSDQISEKINTYTYELLDYFETFELSFDEKDPLIQALFNFCLPLIRTNYPHRILEKIPPIQKKAMIACYIASRLVYQKGIEWAPSIIDILPLIIIDTNRISTFFKNHNFKILT